MSQSCDDDDSSVGAGYDSETNTYHARFDPDTPGSLAGAVVYLVSVATGTEPDAMDRLFDVVDPDALEALFRPSGSGGRRDVQIEFEFCGCDVTAGADGEVRVTPTEARPGE